MRSPMPIIPPITINRASAVGMCFRRSQNKGGAHIIARNAERRKGTRIFSAARIPATTITNAATVIRNWVPFDLLLLSCIELIVVDYVRSS
jgi:hypothetical protein